MLKNYNRSKYSSDLYNIPVHTNCVQIHTLLDFNDNRLKAIEFYRKNAKNVSKIFE